MSNGFLSQEEINSLLNGSLNEAAPEPAKEEILSDIEKDLLGEIGNISMGSASTALSTVINQKVNITTPVVTVTTLKDIKDSFEIPNIALEVKYTSGILGENLLVMKTSDAAVIASLMMGGNGIDVATELSEIEVSAVSEAMNQMIGSAATSMATMFNREINISPPVSKIWDDSSNNLADGVSDSDTVIKVSFKLAIGELVDSSIMQILDVSTAKKIVSIMMGQENEETKEEVKVKETEPSPTYEEPAHSEPAYERQEVEYRRQEPVHEAPRAEVSKAQFMPLDHAKHNKGSNTNLDLILDVPLEISVVLGRTKKNIKDILNFGTGSLVELDKLAEEPVEIQVNGKKIAYGEVVVVDENFGVRITSIVSSADRIKSLSD